MSDRFTTRGENLVGRSLDKYRVAGVPHYVPGQHEAVWMEATDFFTGDREDIARVTYVDVMGHAVVLLCSRRGPDDPWRPTWIGSAGQMTDSPVTRADDFKLSDRINEALANAVEVWTVEALCDERERAARVVRRADEQQTKR